MAKAVIKDLQSKRNSKIVDANDHYTRIKFAQIGATPKTIIPFYVKFTTIGIEGRYGPGNRAPIGIAVIGYSNYIL